MLKVKMKYKPICSESLSLGEGYDSLCDKPTQFRKGS